MNIKKFLNNLLYFASMYADGGETEMVRMTIEQARGAIDFYHFERVNGCEQTEDIYEYWENEMFPLFLAEYGRACEAERI